MTLAQQLIALDDRQTGVNPRTGKPTVRFDTLEEWQAWRASQ